MVCSHASVIPGCSCPVEGNPDVDEAWALTAWVHACAGPAAECVQECDGPPADHIGTCSPAGGGENPANQGADEEELAFS